MRKLGKNDNKTDAAKAFLNFPALFQIKSRVCPEPQLINPLNLLQTFTVLLGLFSFWSSSTHLRSISCTFWCDYWFGLLANAANAVTHHQATSFCQIKMSYHIFGLKQHLLMSKTDHPSIRYLEETNMARTFNSISVTLFIGHLLRSRLSCVLNTRHKYSISLITAATNLQGL